LVLKKSSRARNHTAVDEAARTRKLTTATAGLTVRATTGAAGRGAEGEGGGGGITPLAEGAGLVETAAVGEIGAAGAEGLASLSLGAAGASLAAGGGGMGWAD